MLPSLPELKWPETVLGPPPAAREVRFASVCSLVFALLILVFVLVGGRDRAASLGVQYQEDFVAFYGVGRLLNEHPPDRLYDFRVQEQIYRDLRPDATYLGLPYAHAPFEALLFQPLARLPYETAYLVWLALGMLAYSGALWALFRRFGPPRGPDRVTVLLLALSFSPFMMESWLGGNVAVIPFVAIALAIALEDAGQPVLSGCVLALCLNKPSVLVLILPMLLVSRRFRILAGFVVGSTVLVVASSLILGLHAWPDFIGTMLRWAQMTASQPGLFRDWKYVDINAFSRVLPGGRSWLGASIIVACSLWAVLGLLRMWLALPGTGREARSIAWAAAITWTLVLNAYVPISDCTLLVLAGVLAASALRDPATGSSPPAFVALVALCYVSAWVTQPLAQLLRVQIYTLVLMYTGFFLMRQFQRIRLAPTVSDPMAPA
jgi:Glycosyltransferase family 87